MPGLRRPDKFPRARVAFADVSQSNHYRYGYWTWPALLNTGQLSVNGHLRLSASGPTPLSTTQRVLRFEICLLHTSHWPPGERRAAIWRAIHKSEHPPWAGSGWGDQARDWVQRARPPCWSSSSPNVNAHRPGRVRMHKRDIRRPCLLPKRWWASTWPRRMSMSQCWALSSMPSGSTTKPKLTRR